jgi:hypothetical protein
MGVFGRLVLIGEVEVVVDDGRVQVGEVADPIPLDNGLERRRDEQEGEGGGQCPPGGEPRG